MDVRTFNKEFELTQEQMDKAAEWIRSHAERCSHTLSRMAHALGTPISYTFRMHGSGTEVKVACSCGEKLDISDSTD